MSKSTSNILNRMRGEKKTGAETFLESMKEQVQENKPESNMETKTIIDPQPVPETKPISDTHSENEKETINKTEQFIEPETEQQTITKVEQKSVLEKYSNKKTKEEMFTRQTYLIRNDLIKRLHSASKGRGKGFKTDVINEILERFLNENGL